MNDDDDGRDGGRIFEDYRNGARLVTMEQLLAREVRGNPLIKGIFERESLVSIFGETGAGKTFVALDWALAIATPGADWRGHRVHHGGVVYVAAEDAGGIERRVQAYCAVYPEARRAAFAVIEQAIDLPRVIETERLIADIAAHFDRATEFVVIDTADACFGAHDDSANVGMRAYVNACKSIRDALGCTVLSVMHPGHDNIDRERGGSNFKAAMDFRFRVQAHGDNGIQLTNLKVKNGPLIGPLVFERRIVELGTDDDGDPITSCVLVASNAAPVANNAKKKTSVPESARITADVLTKMTNVRDAIDVFTRETIGNEPTLTPHTKVALVDDWRSECYRRGITESSEPEARKKAFQRAKQSLHANKWIGELDGYAWRIQRKG